MRFSRPSDYKEKTAHSLWPWIHKIVSHCWQWIILLIINIWPTVLLYLTHLAHSPPTKLPVQKHLLYYNENKKQIILISNIQSEKNICWLQIHTKFWQETCGVIQQKQITKHLSENISVHCNKPISTTLSVYVSSYDLYNTYQKGHCRVINSLKTDIKIWGKVDKKCIQHTWELFWSHDALRSFSPLR